MGKIFQQKTIPTYKDRTIGESPMSPGDMDYLAEKLKVIKEQKMAIGGLLAILLLSVGVNFYTVNLPDKIPYVIEVSPWGEAKYKGEIGKVMGSSSRSVNSIRFFLTEFVRRLRETSSDPSIVNRNIDDLTKTVTSTGYNLSKPFWNILSERFRKDIRVEVTIQSILPVEGKNSYQIDWLERYSSFSGQYKKTHHYRGIFNLIFSEPTEKTVKINPLGFFIDEYSFEEIIEEKGDEL